MACSGPKVFNLGKCVGELKRFQDVQKHLQSSVLRLGEIGRKWKTVFSNPFQCHEKRKARDLVGKKFHQLNRLNPGITGPNDTLCQDCFNQACKMQQSSTSASSSDILHMKVRVLRIQKMKCLLQKR